MRISSEKRLWQAPVQKGTVDREKHLLGGDDDGPRCFFTASNRAGGMKMSKKTGQKSYNEHVVGRRQKTTKPPPKRSKKTTASKTANVAAATIDDAKPGDKSGNPRAPNRLTGPATDEGFYAPWIADPDPPETPMTKAKSRRAAKRIAEAFPELVDKSQDRPLREPQGKQRVP